MHFGTTYALEIYKSREKALMIILKMKTQKKPLRRSHLMQGRYTHLYKLHSPVLHTLHQERLSLDNYTAHRLTTFRHPSYMKPNRATMIRLEHSNPGCRLKLKILRTMAEL